MTTTVLGDQSGAWIIAEMFERETPTYDYCDLKRHVLMGMSIWFKLFHAQKWRSKQLLNKEKKKVEMKWGILFLLGVTGVFASENEENKEAVPESSKQVTEDVTIEVDEDDHENEDDIGKL